LLLPCGERRYDDLIEGERKRQQCPR
jgi:hypothetical protein